MKITVSKLFDTSQVIEAFIAAKIGGLEDFVTNLADLSDQVTRALRKKLSLDDNIDCLSREFALITGVSLKFTPPDNRVIKHIIPTKTNDFANPVRSVVWRYLGTGDIELSVEFKLTTANRVTFLMFY